MQVLAIVITAVCGVFGLFFGAIAIVGSLHRKRICPRKAPARRIAVVVAARNEESVIGQLVESLLAQDYPRALFDVYVLPNNCTDDTAEAARRAGATILECDFPVHSKGEVLHFAFETLLPEGYDAYCVFDADNIVDPGFLQAVNDAREAGLLIAQGYRDSKNPDDNWISGCVSIFYWMMDRFYSHARAALGLSTALNGTGFMVSAELLRKNGWNTLSLTEDLEYSAQCAILGVKIGWMENAITYDEQPRTMIDSFNQRRRWSAGSYQCLKLYIKELMLTLSKRSSFHCLDMTILFSGVLMQVVCMIPLVLLVVDAVIRAGLNPNGWSELLIATLIGGLNGWFWSDAAALVICLSEKKLSKARWRAIALFGLYLLTWVPANLLCLVTKAPKWKQIKHVSHATIGAAAKTGGQTHDC